MQKAVDRTLNSDIIWINRNLIQKYRAIRNKSIKFIWLQPKGGTMKHFYSESEALNALNITDFSQINSGNIMKFAKLFKDIDPEVGKLALSMIPEFTKTIKEVLDSYKLSYSRNVDALEKSNADYHSFCSDIVGVLSVMSEKTDNSTEEKAKIIEALLELEARRSINDEAYRAAIREEREAHNVRVDRALGILCSVLVALGGAAIAIGGMNNGRK